MTQRFGFGFLRLSAEDFWRMTPREIFHALSFQTGEKQLPLDRHQLAAMAKKYPDVSQ